MQAIRGVLFSLFLVLIRSFFFRSMYMVQYSQPNYYSVDFRSIRFIRLSLSKSCENQFFSSERKKAEQKQTLNENRRERLEYCINEKGVYVMILRLEFSVNLPPRSFGKLVTN